MPMKDLIQNMDLADFCYPLKTSILIFLEQIYLDTEKEIGEDFANAVWGLISRFEKDLLKFVETMQKLKRKSNGAGIQRAKIAPYLGGSEGDIAELMSHTQSGEVPMHRVQVDVSKNFGFVTNQGSFSISTLMLEYVFEGIINCLIQFLSLRFPMKQNQKELMLRILKLCLLCMPFKTKAIHEKIIIRFVNMIRNSPALSDVMS